MMIKKKQQLQVRDVEHARTSIVHLLQRKLKWKTETIETPLQFLEVNISWQIQFE